MNQEKTLIEELNKIDSLDARIKFLKENASEIFVDNSTVINKKSEPVKASKKNKLISLPSKLLKKYREKLLKNSYFNYHTSVDLSSDKVNKLVFTLPTFFINNVKSIITARSLAKKEERNKLLRVSYNVASRGNKSENSLTNEQNAIKEKESKDKSSKKIRLNLAKKQKGNRRYSYLRTFSKSIIRNLKDYIQFKYGLYYVDKLDKLEEKEIIKRMKEAHNLEELAREKRLQDRAEDFIMALKEEQQLIIASQRERINELNEEYATIMGKNHHR